MEEGGRRGRKEREEEREEEKEEKREEGKEERKRRVERPPSSLHYANGLSSDLPEPLVCMQWNYSC